VLGVLACLGLWLVLLLCELISSAMIQRSHEEAPPIWDASATEILQLIGSGASGRILEARWLAALVPLILLCAFSFGRAADWQRYRWRGEKSRWQQLRETLSIKADPSSIVQRDLRPLALLIIEIAMLGLILGPWIAFAVWPNSDSAVLFVGLIGVLWVLYLVRALWIWLRLPGRRAAWRYALGTYRSVLGAFIVTASVLWLLIAVISLPLRRKADSNIEAMIKLGEVRALSQFK
jgi:hypothetical protein